MDEVIARHAFKTYTSYVAKVGRAQFIEIHIAVPPSAPIDSVGEADAIAARDFRGDRRRGASALAHHRFHRRSASGCRRV